MQTWTNDMWVDWAIELQSLAQIGLTYAKDDFDCERYERIRAIAAEIMTQRSGLPVEVVQKLFCNETGFQTPKLDTRAAVFKDEKILLVKECDGRWALPGGWVDIDQTVGQNAVKEVKEEAGLDVVAERLIAVLDRNRHNPPPYAYGICKILVLCRLLSGSFQPNNETLASAFFRADDLPALAEEKSTEQQIQLCFQAYQDEHWKVVFD